MKKIIILVILNIFYNSLTFAQKDISFPCAKDIKLIDIHPTIVRVSSFTGDFTPNFSVDGKTEIENLDEKGFTKTYKENNPWWEVDLEDSYFLKNIQIWSPDNTFAEGMVNYYILTSEYPFSDTDLYNQLASPNVKYVYIEGKQSNGFEIPMEFRQAQFIRIQAAGNVSLSLTEVGIYGGVLKDICGNGIDDDCDGKSDCDDSDCGAILVNTNGINPTCPYCKDGKISIQAAGHFLSYSIDGGKTFTKCKSTGGYYCEFPNLPEGTYEIIVRNDDTGCTTTKTIVLKAKVGLANDCCPNAGFENGTFTGWVGSDGLIKNINLANNTTISPTSKYHTIIPSGNSNDPIVGSGIKLTSPSGANYIVKLGDNKAGGFFAKMEYCMKVKECNQFFSFNYALVLQDIDHDPSIQPFFKWLIKNKSGATLASFTPIIANLKNPYFTIFPVVNDDPFDYRSWTCEILDLSKFMGQDICIEFTVTDCSSVGHLGYAYIDGVCGNKESAKPIAKLNIASTICKNQKVTASGLESKNFNKYSWEVCRYINGQAVSCFFSGDKYDNKPIIDDVLGFFFNPPHNPTPLKCGDKFRVTLFLNNGCFDEKVSKDFTYICEDAPQISYPDIVLCSNKDDVQITGTNNCKNCTYNWAPAQYLDDAKIEFPTILGGSNSLALDQTYSVTAVSPNGCLTTNNLKIFQSGELFGKGTFTYENSGKCDFIAFVEFEFDTPIDASKLNAYVSIDSKHIVGCQLLTSGVLKKHKFRIPGLLPRCSDHTFDAFVSFAKGLPDNFNQIGNCAISVNTIRNGDSVNGKCEVNIFMPNAFTPNDDGVDDTFYPNFSPNMIFFAHILIFDRFGSLLFEGDITAKEGEYLTGAESELTWNGFFKGTKSPGAVYTVILEFDACTTEKKTCGKVTEKGKKVLLTNPNNNFICSDVTLVWN
jgi:gliding motility-associated-like protein